MHLECRVCVRWAFPLVLALVLLAAGAAGHAVAMKRDTIKLHTQAGVKVINVEITETQEEKARGLMFRKYLADTDSMLFFYDRPIEVTMWMRNTLIPLDMVFIRPDGVVHRIEPWTKPLSEDIISSRAQVSACLELAGGAADRLGLKPGDRVEHPLFRSSKN